jgi:16S rRNA (uracil1498-N3)-methyltransferase
VHRFYIPASEWDPDQIVITGADAHHCHDVVRCQVGERVIAFDGCGTQALGTIAASGRSRVELEVESLEQTAPLRAALTLCQAIPKGKNMDLVVQKATELGVSHIVPLLTENTVVRLGPQEAAKKQQKWQRVAIEACKQSGQNWMPQVASPVSLSQWLAAQSDPELKLIASLQAGAKHLKEILGGCGTRPGSAQILIGPEGDFTGGEVDAAIAAGHQPITLGPIILRTETAAIYCLSVLAHELF